MCKRQPAGPQTLCDASKNSCLPQVVSLLSSEYLLNDKPCLTQSRIMCKKIYLERIINLSSKLSGKHLRTNKYVILYV